MFNDIIHSVKVSVFLCTFFHSSGLENKLPQTFYLMENKMPGFFLLMIQTFFIVLISVSENSPSDNFRCTYLMAEYYLCVYTVYGKVLKKWRLINIIIVTVDTFFMENIAFQQSFRMYFDISNSLRSI